jgi:DNA-binding cell septation regulator SpoVG
MEIKITDRRTVGKMQFFTADLGGTLISDCKVMSGPKGEWVSGPARKGADKDGNEKWFNYVRFSFEHQKAIIAAFHESEEAVNPAQAQNDEQPPPMDDDDCPF